MTSSLRPNHKETSTTIAVASGKGGTGKTTVSVNLAMVSDRRLSLLDCDVEEPNVHLFIHPPELKSERFAVSYPSFDQSLCDGCGECREKCRFNAIAVFGTSPLLFPELCHSCGACIPACPTGAIHETPGEIGTVYYGTYDHVNLAYGTLDIGQARSAPLIERIREFDFGNELVIVDAPPGTSCPVIASVRHVDYVLLVTEPTPFGLNDLKLAVEMCRRLGLRFGVVINRADIGDATTEEYCRSEEIVVLASLPYNREVAEVYSRGGIPSLELPKYRAVFRELLGRLKEEAGS